MKGKHILVLIGFILSGNLSLNAQGYQTKYSIGTHTVPKDLPFYKNYFYDQLVSGKVAKTPLYFDLKGPVKTITDSVQHLNILGRATFIRQIGFTKNGLIQTMVEGDTSKIFPLASAEFYYYAENNRPIKKVVRKFEADNISETVFLYDSFGYVIMRTDGLTPSRRSEKQEYSYKTIYSYDSGYSGVAYRYEPIKGKLHEKEGGLVKFEFDRNGTFRNFAVRDVVYDSFNRPVYYFVDHGCGVSNKTCMRVFTMYDSVGNIIGQRVLDYTASRTLSSFSYSYKAKYNVENLLVSKINLPVPDDLSIYQFPVGRSDWPIDENFRYEPEVYVLDTNTYKYIFDSHGNWTEMRVHTDGKLSSITKREISYHE